MHFRFRALRIFSPKSSQTRPYRRFFHNLKCFGVVHAAISCKQFPSKPPSHPIFPLTPYAHLHILKMMRAERLCITLPPRLCRRVKKEADRRQVSVSKCIADYIEKNTDDDLVYSKEELDRRIKEGDAEYARGEAKSFRSIDEMFKALNEECDLHEAVL